MRAQHDIHQAYALDGENDSAEESGLGSDEREVPFHEEDDDVSDELNLLLSFLG